MQRFQSILQFKKVSCKNCYKCVRNCPVKAIRVHDHQARIIESQCIYCEKCILVCPQDAKEEQNMIPAIRSAMENKAQVVASLHPAYLARFGVTGINGIREAMKKLGFADVADAAEGASLMTAQYRTLFSEQKEQGVMISSACPVIVQLVKKHYPHLLGNLVESASMMQFHANYLKKQYPEVYRNPIEAFREIDQTTEFPEMYRLLSELQDYRGTGIAAKLYYESKVAEALSLVVEYQKKRSVSDHKLVSQDLERIQTVAAYLSDHYAGGVPIECLAQIACMGTTKLKSSFKKVYGCTITEYIQQRRMSQAEYLLAHTDLQIGQIAQTIGYSTSSRFAELFRRSTGLLPLEYRKMAKRK